MTYTPYKFDVNPSHEGPRGSNLLILAESPWKTEVAAGRPLCGASGNKLNYWLQMVGLSRPNIRIENLYPYRPRTTDLTSVSDVDLIPWVEDVHQRIAKMPNLNLIVTLGNYATFALTGKGKVRASLRNHFLSDQFEVNVTLAEKKVGVTQLRGSIYEYVDLNGRSIKVMPTIHPAAILRQPIWEKRCLVDWRKAFVECQFPNIIKAERKHIIDPTEEEVAKYLKSITKNYADIDLAVDIETWGRTLSCVGFAVSPVESLTIPTVTKQEKEVFLPYIKKLCESKCDKILCNGLYDWYWLDKYDIQLVNYYKDVQLAHHALDPVNSHSLDFLSSLYTRQNYWKDEAKDAEELIKYANKRDAVLEYNGIDCCVTREVWPVLERLLREEGLLNFYYVEYGEMIPILQRMHRHGVRTDVEGQKAWAKTLRKTMGEVRAELEEGAGQNLFASKRKSYLREPTNAEWDALLIDGEVTYKNGVPVGKCIDKEARKKLIEEQNLTYRIGGKDAGKMMYSKEEDQKSFSKKKLENFFYGTLGMPPVKKRNKQTGKFGISLDEASIHTLNRRFPDKIGNYGNLLIKYRSLGKKLDACKGSYDKDGRMRTYYKMITKEGRLSSSKNPMYTGRNLQNIER